MQTNRNKGNKFEDIAISNLVKKGYIILGRNYYAGRYGEIDIIAQKNEIIVFVEVKGRKSLKYGPGETAITRTKKIKLIKSCQIWMIKNNIERDWQIDVISIEETSTNKFKLKHFRNCINQNDYQ